MCGKEARGFTGGDVLTEHAVLATFPRAQPGDINRRPCVISPYHYRMDWLMWFAAMGSYGQYPWLVLLVDRLLEGNPAVFPFFVTNPFPDPNAPPARTFLSEAWSSNDDAVKSQSTNQTLDSQSLSQVATRTEISRLHSDSSCPLNAVFQQCPFRCSGRGNSCVC